MSFPGFRPLRRPFIGALWLAAASLAAHAQQEMPARFDQGGVYVTLPTRDGHHVTLYTDTGGGGLVLSRDAARRLGLPEPATVPAPAASAPQGPQPAWLPAPVLARGWPPLPDHALLLPKAEQVPGWPEQGDGFLGAPWFAGGVWTWDYPRQRLVKERADWEASAAARRIPAYFLTEPDGSRTTNFPRIEIDVAGERIPVLLDTGAETYLTPAAAQALGGGPRLRATSMLAASMLDRLHAAHPAWRYLADAQEVTGAAMLEVPDVRVAGLQVGPVWFTRRPDRNFHEFMSSMMDAQVEGSVGANALACLQMTIDYPRAEVAFTAAAPGNSGTNPACVHSF